MKRNTKINLQYYSRTTTWGDLGKIEKALVAQKPWHRTAVNMVTKEHGRRYDVKVDDSSFQHHNMAVYYWGSLVAGIEWDLTCGAEPVSVSVCACGYFTKQTKEVINATLIAAKKLSHGKFDAQIVGRCTTQRHPDCGEWYIVTSDGVHRWYGERVSIYADGSWDMSDSVAEDAKTVQYEAYRNQQRREGLALERQRRAQERKVERALAKKAKAIEEKWAAAPLASLRMGEKLAKFNN